MAEDNKHHCKLCGKYFDDIHALNQHNQALHPNQKSVESRKSMKKLAFIAIAVIVIGAVMFFGYKGLAGLAAKEELGPFGEDHWHADYSVQLCGETKEADLPFSEDIGIHTHGDGRIHIHPHGNPAYEGQAANLKRFFQSANLTLTDTSLTWIDGKTYTSGETECEDGHLGSLVIMANGQQVNSTYVPKDGDRVEIIFEH
jgi:hypothetical protein